MDSLAPGAERVTDAMLRTLTTMIDEEDTNGDRQTEAHDPDRTAVRAHPAEAPGAVAERGPESAAPRAGEGVVIPDSITPVVGWRSWQVEHDGRLVSPTMVGFVWQPGVPAEAACRTARGRHETRKCKCPKEPTPARRCTCGLYAVRELNTFRESGFSNEDVIGRVALWGTVHEHRDGWRGQFGYPQAFYVAPNRLRELHQVLEPFGVPILSAADLPPRAVADDEPADPPTVPTTCRECGSAVLARSRGRVLCDVCREINRQLSPLRTARQRATGAGVDENVASLNAAIALLEARRPSRGGAK